MPGYGAQGAGPEDAAQAFDHHGRGAVVNSSRGILFPKAGRPGRLAGEGRWEDAAAAAAEEMRDALARALDRRR